MAKALKEKIHPPELLISSPALRAATTAEYLAPPLNYEIENIKFEHSLYAADMRQLLECLSGLDNQLEQVILVGHNPGITDLVNYLSGVEIDNIPTCGICILSIKMKDWGSICQGSAELLDFDYPKKAR